MKTPIPLTLLQTSLLTALLASLLPACSVVGPNYQPPANPLPATYHAADNKNGQARSNWWASFEDAQMSRLIERALQNSPDLAVAQARLRQARALQGIQHAADGPALAAGAKVTSDKLSKNSEMLANLPFKNVNTDFTNHQIGFDASWEIDLFGHQQRLNQAADARSNAASERLQDMRLIIAAEVARNYIELRATQYRLALFADNLQNYDELLRLASISAKHGESAQLEVMRARANRDNYAANQAPLQMLERQSLLAISVLTTENVAELAQELHTATRQHPQLMPLPNPPAAGLPSELLKRRADLRAIEQEMIAANAEIGAAIANLYPRFSLLGTGGWASISRDSLLDAASRTWNIGPQLSFPLFTGGRLKGQVKANQAAYEASLASYRKASLVAVADVETALTRITTSQTRQQDLQQAEQQQREIVKLTLKQWQLGESSKLAQVDAQRNLLVQQDSVAQAKAQSLLAVLSLYKALGGGWE